MTRYRKLPVEISARFLTEENLEELEKWCGGSIKGISLPRREQCINIQTREGEMRADIGDYIIKGVKGEFYPCKEDIFNLTYEWVGE